MEFKCSTLGSYWHRQGICAPYALWASTSLDCFLWVYCIVPLPHLIYFDPPSSSHSLSSLFVIFFNSPSLTLPQHTLLFKNFFNIIPSISFSLFHFLKFSKPIFSFTFSGTIPMPTSSLQMGYPDSPCSYFVWWGNFHPWTQTWSTQRQLPCIGFLWVRIYNPNQPRWCRWGVYAPPHLSPCDITEPASLHPLGHQPYLVGADKVPHLNAL